MIRRINFYGGAGCGKSTTAAWLFAQMKMDGYNVEHIQEFVKTWTYEHKVPKSFDQIHLLGQQMYKEDIVLRNDVDHLVTDCPIFLGACYSMYHNFAGWGHVVGLAKCFDDVYPSLNLFIDRGDKPYKAHGRFQTAEEARKIDEYVKEKLSEYGHHFHVVKYQDLENIKNLVYSELGVQ